MNEVMKAILERRSFRKYKPDMVEKDLIDELRCRNGNLEISLSLQTEDPAEL